MDNIITKIESMRETGKLTTEQSVDFILQLLLDLHEGQQGIMEVLIKRENEIHDLDSRTTSIENRMNIVETKIATIEGLMISLTDNLKINSKILDRLDQEIKETADIAHQTKRRTVYYWFANHKALSMFFMGGIVLLINFHEDVYKFILALLGIRLP